MPNKRPRFFPPRLPGRDPLDMFLEIQGEERRAAASRVPGPGQTRAPKQDRELGLVLRPKSQDPTPWLKPYQLRFADAIKRADDETRHLTGQARLQERMRLTGLYIQYPDLP